jgi:hypothetical protein
MNFWCGQSLESGCHPSQLRERAWYDCEWGCLRAYRIGVTFGSPTEQPFFAVVSGAFVGLYTVVDGKTIANAGKDDSQSKEQRFGGDSQRKEKIFEDNGARDRGMPYLFHPRMQSLKFDWRPQWGCWRSNDAHRELWGSLM